MLALPATERHRFTQHAKRCFRGPPRRFAQAPVRLDGQGKRLWLRGHFGEVVLGLHVPTPTENHDFVTLSFGDWELQTGSAAPVTAASTVPAEPNWPAVPEHLDILEPNFLAALHELGRYTSSEAGRYASHRVQLHGGTGEVISTDCKQALLYGGFAFPFSDALLVPAIPLFGSKEFQRVTSVHVGRIGDWFYVQAADWSVWLALDRAGRFPKPHDLLPKRVSFRWELHERDVATLQQVFATEKPTKEDEPQVTVVLGSPLLLRWRDAQHGNIRELQLRSSQCSGDKVTVVLSREQLELSLRLGFRAFQGAQPEQPLCAVAGERTHLLLAHPTSSALGPPKEAQKHTTLAEILEPVASKEAVSPPNTRSPIPMPKSHVSPEQGREEETTTLDPLTEAEALRAALSEAHQCANRLIHSLKHMRKERRTLANVFSNLRQLNLGGRTE